MKKPMRNEGQSFKPTDRCRDCGCWLRCGNNTGYCAVHAKPSEKPQRKLPLTAPEPTSH